MSSDPDEIRAEIERTRAELSSDVDALGNKISPSQVAHRKVEAVKDAAGSLKEKVMGVSHDAKDSVSHTGEGVSQAAHGVGHGVAGAAQGVTSSVSSAASSAAGAVRSVPGTVQRQTEGNPLAAGLVAFGLGWLLGSLVPATTKEQEVAGKVKEQAAGVVDEAKSVAGSIAEELKEPAQQAAQSVKDKAAEAGQTLKDQGQSAAEDLKGQAAEAKDHVQGNQGDTSTSGGQGGTYPTSSGYQSTY